MRDAGEHREFATLGTGLFSEGQAPGQVGGGKPPGPVGAPAPRRATELRAAARHSPARLLAAPGPVTGVRAGGSPPGQWALPRQAVSGECARERAARLAGCCPRHSPAGLPAWLESLFPLLKNYEEGTRSLLEVLRNVVAMASTLAAEQEELADQLRELMARRASLRRSDFDRIFDDLREHRESTRCEVHRALAGFGTEDEAWQHTIEEILGAAFGGRGEGDVDLELVRERLRTAFVGHDQRLMELADRLMAFQWDQEELASAMGTLLARADKVQPRHLQQTVEALRHRWWIRRQPAFRAVKQFERISDRLVAEWGELPGAPCAPEMEGPVGQAFLPASQSEQTRMSAPRG